MDPHPHPTLEKLRPLPIGCTCLGVGNKAGAFGTSCSLPSLVLSSLSPASVSLVLSVSCLAVKGVVLLALGRTAASLEYSRAVT